MRKITKVAVMSCCLLLIAGLAYCGSFPNSTGPKSESEAFPYRNQDPRLGVVVNAGTANLNIFIYDEANRLVEQAYFEGANRWFTVNGQYTPRYWIKRLEVGRYRVEVYPFYYQTTLVPPGRYRIDLLKYTIYMMVNRDPADTYFGGRYWGWVLFINGGYIPDTAHGLPGVRANVWGDFR